MAGTSAILPFLFAFWSSKRHLPHIFPLIFPTFSHRFPPAFPHIFPWVFPAFSHGFSLDFPHIFHWFHQFSWLFPSDFFGWLKATAMAPRGRWPGAGGAPQAARAAHLGGDRPWFFYGLSIGNDGIYDEKYGNDRKLMMVTMVLMDLLGIWHLLNGFSIGISLFKANIYYLIYDDYLWW